MSIAVIAPSAGSAIAPDPIRVMLVDDAVVVRGMISRWVEAEPDMQIVASLGSGRDAIEQIERRNPDVVILDVTMPDLDGITVLPRLLAKKSDLVVIMASTLTRRNAEISLRALSLGAADYIPKPETSREVTSSSSFRRELVDKIRALGSRRKRRSSAPTAVTPGTAARIGPRPGRAPPDVAKIGIDTAESGSIVLRPLPLVAPRVLLMGSSTGGPQALNAILAVVGAVVDRVPVLITQHMPPTFTPILAEHLTRASGRPAAEAADGEPVCAGRIYVAPGGRHMRLERRDGEPTITLDDGPAVHFCKPAVDPLFSSAAAVWGAAVLAVVLTGMGQDGARGAAAVVAAGGGVIVQDEATSVVWGMPGTVAQAGHASAVLPLDQIGPRLVGLFAGAGRDAA
jgi:two-component system chemotaxis response regulator CheB